MSPVLKLPTLVLLLSLSTLADCASPPTGTASALNNIGSFDGSSGLLQSCVTLQDAQGVTQRDLSGKPLVYDVTMNLRNTQELIFRLQSYGFTQLASGKDCSGVFRNGSYTDTLLVSYPGSGLNGSAVRVTMDIINSVPEFRLRTDAASFGAVRNFANNTTALGGSLGDFLASTTREYGTANLPGTVLLKLPLCNDAQGDNALVVVEKDGAVIGAVSSGGEFPLNTNALAVGSHQYRVFCSDEASIRSQLTTLKLAVQSSYFARSDYAPGTLKVTIVNGTASTGSTAGSAGALTFQFAASTSSSEQNLIQQAAEFARDFFTTTFGRTLQKASSITTSTTAQGCNIGGGAAAFTGPQSLTICSGNPGWTNQGNVNKQKIIIHELFHLLQYELRWLGNQNNNTGAHWLIEGAAEYTAWLGIANKGTLSLESARGCMTKEVADFALQQPPGLPNLSALETPQSFSTPGPVYPLAMLGTDKLVTDSSINALINYGTSLAAGTPATTAFASAFGISATNFYSQFPAWKAGLTVPLTYLCRI